MSFYFIYFCVEQCVNLTPAVNSNACRPRTRTDLDRSGLPRAVGPGEVHDRPAFQAGRRRDVGGERRLEARGEAVNGLPDALRRRQAGLGQADVLLRGVCIAATAANGFSESESIKMKLCADSNQ